MNFVLSVNEEHVYRRLTGFLSDSYDRSCFDVFVRPYQPQKSIPLLSLSHVCLVSYVYIKINVLITLSVFCLFCRAAAGFWEAWTPSWCWPVSFDLWPLGPGSKPCQGGDGVTGARWFEAASSKCFHMLPLVRLVEFGMCENQICGKPKKRVLQERLHTVC